MIILRSPTIEKLLARWISDPSIIGAVIILSMCIATAIIAVDLNDKPRKYAKAGDEYFRYYSCLQGYLVSSGDNYILTPEGHPIECETVYIRPSEARLRRGLE